jgi:hypothetical protein
MRRIMLAVFAVAVALVPMTAQQKTPKGCAIFVNVDPTKIWDPSPVTCEQDGDVGVLFCNHTGDKLSITLKKEMKYNGTTVQVLKSDITKNNIPDGKCDFSQSKVLANATPHSKPPYLYTVTTGKLSLDPDMDVAPPSGIEPQGRGRGRR